MAGESVYVGFKSRQQKGSTGIHFHRSYRLGQLLKNQLCVTAIFVKAYMTIKYYC